jgi:hypothetical protein
MASMMYNQQQLRVATGIPRGGSSNKRISKQAESTWRRVESAQKDAEQEGYVTT